MTMGWTKCWKVLCHTDTANCEEGHSWSLLFFWPIICTRILLLFQSPPSPQYYKLPACLIHSPETSIIVTIFRSSSTHFCLHFERFLPTKKCSYQCFVAVISVSKMKIVYLFFQGTDIWWQLIWLFVCLQILSTCFWASMCGFESHAGEEHWTCFVKGWITKQK